MGEIIINKINNQWVGMITDCDKWLPLPFTAEADLQSLIDFYLDRFEEIYVSTGAGSFVQVR